MKKIVLSVILLIFSVSLLVFSIFAWFTNRTTLSNLIITTGNVEVSALLYKWDDFDYDGILDIDQYGEEIFTEVDTSQSYLVAGLNPGDTVTFTLYAENIGNIDGTLSILFGSFGGDLQGVIVYDAIKLDFVNESIQDIIYDGDTLTAANILSGTGEKTLVSEELLQTEQACYFTFTLKFATLAELQSIDSEFLLYDNLNEYMSVPESTPEITANIKHFTMTITVQLMQYAG